MMRNKLPFSCGFLLAAILAAIVGRADGSRRGAPSISGSSQLDCLGSMPCSRGGYFDRGQTFPPIAAVETGDTDDEEPSDRGDLHAAFATEPSACPSRRATRMASSVQQRRQNTLNALCVRLQI